MYAFDIIYQVTDISIGIEIIKVFSNKFRLIQSHFQKCNKNVNNKYVLYNTLDRF